MWKQLEIVLPKAAHFFLTLEVGFNIRCADKYGRKDTHWGSREHSPQGRAGQGRAQAVFPWVLGGKSWLSFHRRGLS